MTSRRDFLKHATLGVSGLWLAHCGRGTSLAGGADESDDALASAILTPTSAGYDKYRVLYNTQFDSVRPVRIARCATAADVQAALVWAQKNGADVVPRSGGHSYAGYSTTPGVMIDVRPMNSVVVGATTAKVGAGAKLIDVYNALWTKKMTIPAGSCPTVGIAGHALGGGYGLASRAFGTVSDNILEVQIVTADGRVLTCNASNNADLYWACRGGGGGNFGVVTSFTFQLHPVDVCSHFTIKFAWKDAAAVFDAWQQWAPLAPDALTSLIHLTAGATEPVLTAVGEYQGSVAALTAVLAPLLAAAAPTSKTINSASYMNTMMIWAGCRGSVAQCHLPVDNAAGTLTRYSGRAKSDYVNTIMPAEGIATMIDWVNQRQHTGGGGGVLIDSYGGAIARMAPEATAFFHRDPLYCLQYFAGESQTATATQVQANLAYLNEFRQAMRPYVSGRAYQNYIDTDLQDWQQAYYGDNFDRLVQVKTAYDPTNVFHFEQSIPVSEV